MQVPFARPDLTHREVVAVTKVIESGELATGRWVDQFEEKFAAYVGAPYAVAVGSCTQGFHLLFQATHCHGRPVVTPTYTFTGPAMMAKHSGAEVMFVDNQPWDWTPTPAGFVDQYRPLGRVTYMPVHFGGEAYPIEDLRLLDKNALIFADAAHAAGTRYASGKRVGGTDGATATVFSFYATKTLCTGNGGMITTSDGDLARELKKLRLHGLSKDMRARYDGVSSDWAYDVERPGWKANLTDMAAAMGMIQLDRLDEMRAARAKIGIRYTQAFRDHMVTPYMGTQTDRLSWHLFPVVLEDKQQRDRMFTGLQAQGVGTTVNYTPLHKHTAWQYEAGENEFPESEIMFDRALSLPIYSKMTDSQVDHVIKSVLSVLKEETRA